MSFLTLGLVIGTIGLAGTWGWFEYQRRTKYQTQSIIGLLALIYLILKIVTIVSFIMSIFSMVRDLLS